MRKLIPVLLALVGLGAGVGAGFLLRPAPGATQAADGHGAETAEGFEVGYRTLAMDRRLNLGLTAYHYTYDDLQVQFFDPLTMSLTAGNAGKLRTMGIEADFNYRVAGVDGLSFRGAAAWNVTPSTTIR